VEQLCGLAFLMSVHGTKQTILPMLIDIRFWC